MTAVGLGGAGLLPAGVCGSPAWPARAPISCDFRLGSLRTGTGGNGILRRFGWGVSIIRIGYSRTSTGFL
jgi:hypothetical protein